MTPIVFYVKPYLRKFIIKTYGKEPVYLRADSDFGLLMRLAILKDNYMPLEEMLEIEPSVDDSKKNNGVKLKFALSFRVSQGKLTIDNMARLGEAIDNEFDKAMYYFVKGLRVMKVSESKAVKTFLDVYGIEESDGLKLETAIKIAQRSRDEKENKSSAYK